MCYYTDGLIIPPKEPVLRHNNFFSSALQLLPPLPLEIMKCLAQLTEHKWHTGGDGAHL